MKKIYLIGGEDYRSDELDKLNQIILKDFNLNKTFLIIPFATEKEKRRKWIDAVKTSFLKIKDINFDILSEKDTKNEKMEKIEHSDLIFFTGGSPEILIDKIYKSNILTLIKSYKGILVGYSAGALAFSDFCFILKDKEYPRSQIIKGLGIVDFTTSVHYESDEKDEIRFFF